MNKKAQGISMNVIIIAAIALLVLVILSVIFIGRMGSFGRITGDCTTQGGRCLASPCNVQTPPMASNSGLNCEEESTPYCCLPVQ